MDSSVFKEEISKLKFRSINDSYIISVTKRAKDDLEVMELYHGSDGTLDEYVRVFGESIPACDISNEHLKNFLRVKRLLKNAIAEDNDIINYYCDMDSMKDRALPIFAAEEIAVIIITAFLTGAFSDLGKKLISKLGELFSKKGMDKKELRNALQLIFTNTILDQLEKNKEGLTSGEIAEITGMRLEEVIEYLIKYESQGWIRKKIHHGLEKWNLKKERAKIVEGYFKRSGG